MVEIIAALVSLGCIAASLRRLRLAIAPSEFDVRMLDDAIGSRDDLKKLRAALETHAGWERDLLAAALDDDPARAGAEIEEQVLDADWATQRWGRVPRVCASVATSLGFLCAAVVLIQGLGATDMSTLESGSILRSALDALALGIVGMGVSVAVHLRARAVTRNRREAVDHLADKLRRLAIP